MSDQQSSTPQSPEVQPPDVRRELAQTDTTHEGYSDRPLGGTQSEQLGAVETEVTPVMPPVSGPSRLTKGDDEGEGVDDQPLSDPADMITPG